MNDLQKLETIFRAAELALLNGADRDLVRRCAQELAEVLKPKEVADAPAPK